MYSISIFKNEKQNYTEIFKDPVSRFSTFSLGNSTWALAQNMCIRRDIAEIVKETLQYIIFKNTKDIVCGHPVHSSLGSFCLISLQM
jgi:hypothetical protein